MNRLPKLAAVLTWGALVGGLVTGAAATTATTTTSPVTLCVGFVTRLVTAPPASGICPSSAKPVQVGAAGDVASLAKRMDAAEARISALQSQLAADESTITGLENLSVLNDRTILALEHSATALSTLGGPRLQISMVVDEGVPDIDLAGAGLTPGSIVELYNSSGTLIRDMVTDYGAIAFGTSDSSCHAPYQAVASSPSGDVWSNKILSCG